MYSSYNYINNPIRRNFMAENFSSNEDNNEELFSKEEQNDKESTENISGEEIQVHGKHYSEEKFWKKIQTFGEKSWCKNCLLSLTSILHLTMT